VFSLAAEYGSVKAEGRVSGIKQLRDSLLAGDAIVMWSEEALSVFAF
jgi:hypothetical protein